MSYNRDKIDETLGLLFQHSLDFVYVIDLKGNFVDANDVILTALGYEKEDLTKVNFKDVLNKEDLAKAVRILNEILNTGTQQSPAEYTLKTKDGFLLYVETYAMPLRKEGRIYALLGIAHSITQRKLAEARALESEDIGQSLFEFSPYAIIMLKTDGTIADVNRTTQKIFGYTKDYLVGKSFLNLSAFPEDFMPIAKKTLEEVNSGITPKPKEFQAYKSDKTLVWVASHHALFKVRNENYFMVVIQDITDKKAAEENLSESEKKFRALFKEGLDPTYIWQKTKDDFELVDYNNAAEKSTMGSVRNFLGKKASEMYVDRPDIIEDLNKCFKQQTFFVRKMKYYYNFAKKEKDMIVGYGFVNPYVLVSAEDITDKLKFEENLKASEEKFRDLFNRSPFAIILFDEKGIIVDVNQSTERLYGYGKNELVDQPYISLTNVYSPATASILKMRADERKKSHIVEPVEFQVKKKDGSIAWITSSISSIKIGEQKLFQAIVQDITEKRQAELKLKESEENYRKAYERENFYKDLFAHDTKNILQAILMSLELLNMTLSKDISLDAKLILDTIADQVNRGSNLVNNVQKFSKLDGSSIKLEKVNVHDVLENALEFVKKSFSNKSINLTLEEFEKQYCALADDFLIEVFENILINAIKHNNSDLIEVNVKVSKVSEEDLSFLKIEFIDNGIGIPDNRKDLIFQRGFNEGKSVSGMGLGLVLVKVILNRYNAKIKVENKDPNDFSKGSNFIIIIPLEN